MTDGVHNGPGEGEPREIGGFRIEGVLGRGGMGVVYRAVSTDGAPVALKVLLSDADPASAAFARFKREAGIRIEHRNVVRVLDAGFDEAAYCPYIAFERLEGESLWDRLRRGPLPPPEACSLAIQACRGLAAAHAAGVIHRDLKPGNLFLCTDGTLKVLDFGIARLTTESTINTEVTKAGQVVGTPTYLAPEQARGNATLGPQVDVWGLGVLLYEMLCRKRPFEGDSHVTVMLAIVLNPPIPLSSRAPDLPEDLVHVVHRCLEKAPRDRFEDMNALRKALESLEFVPRVAGAAPAAGDTSRPEPPAEEPTAKTGAIALSPEPGEVRVVAIVMATGVRDESAVEAAVTSRGGVFIPLLGQRGIGIFGAEAWEGDEVARAASAALEVRRAAERVALASGRAQHDAYGIAGDVVRAAEVGCEMDLEGVAVPADTAPALEGGFALKRVHAGLFELDEERPPYFPLAMQQKGAEQPILGRSTEVEQLREVLHRGVADGRAESVLIIGPPGVGKTRLRQEMDRLLEEWDETVIVLSARAQPLYRSSAYALLSQALEARARLGCMLRGWPRIDSEAPLEERRRGVRTLVEDVCEEDDIAEELGDFLGEIMGIPMPDSDALLAARSDPELMSDRLHMALIDYMTAACDRGALALVVEDLQWADAASLRVLEDALDMLRDHAFLLLGTGRPELDERWPFAVRVETRLELRGLNSQAVAILAERIGEAPLGQEVLEAVISRTEGNPLFIEQIVSELRDRGHLAELPEDLPLPLSVEAAVQGRLDQLPREEKELLKSAAVYGRPFREEEVAALGLGDANRQLRSLGRRDILASRARMRGPESGREYRFRSTLVADIAYRMLADEIRTELHRRAAEFLAAEEDPDAEEVANHYERAEQPGLAASHFAAAALKAERRGDSARTLRCAERALDLGAPANMLHALHMARADALRFLGRRNEQITSLNHAIASAQTDAERARAHMEWAMWSSRTGRSEEALSTIIKAVLAARASGQPDLIARAIGQQATMWILAGQLKKAAGLLEEAEAAGASASPRTRAYLAEWRGRLATAMGEPGVQVEAYTRATTLYLEAGDLRRASAMETNVADTYNRLGAYAEAEEALRAAVQKCRRLGHRLAEGYALVNLGYALDKLQRTAEALEALDAAWERATVSEDARLGLFARLYRARAMVTAGVEGSGDGAAAQTAIADAVHEALGVAELARDMDFPGVQVLALSVAARGHLLGGQPDLALASSTEAMNLRDELGSAEEDEAEVFATHADALEAAGQPRAAAEARAAGWARIEDIAARIHDQEWRTRFKEDIASHRTLAPRDI